MGARDFDPIALGNAECDGWAAYYRREWRPFLRAAVGMVRTGFGMSWPRTIRGAWYVLRANQVWAPYPDNDPPRARDYMRRFYELVVHDGQLRLDPSEAATRVSPDAVRELDDPLLAAERAELIASYTALLGAVHR